MIAGLYRSLNRYNAIFDSLVHMLNPKQYIEMAYDYEIDVFND